jgi:hypothetical protein
MSGFGVAAWGELALPGGSAAVASFLVQPVDPALCEGWGFKKPTVRSLLQMFAHLNRRRHEGAIHGACGPRSLLLRGYTDSEPRFWKDVMLAFFRAGVAVSAYGSAHVAEIVDSYDVITAFRLVVTPAGKVTYQRLASAERDALGDEALALVEYPSD